MISGNCNRSPQYNVTMGPPGGGSQKYGPQVFVHQQQHPQWLFMAGTNAGGFSQPISRGFSMIPNRGKPSHPTAVFQCTVQHGFGNGFGYQHGNAAPPMFQQHHQQLFHQPHLIHHQHQQHPQKFVPQQQYVVPPPSNNQTDATSGFINGIKNMVKGIIHPLNCDFYSDHHKYYNPKYRNNYMRDLKNENFSYKPPQSHPQPDPHVKSVIAGMEMNKPIEKPASDEEKKTSPESAKKELPDVVAIFNSEDFPELPAPRRSRSVTPAKTETVTSATLPASKPCESTENDDKKDNESSTSVRKHPPPKGTFFEISIRTSPSGRKPTFGGRLKVVPPPFSLNNKPTCNSSKSTTSNSSTNKINNKDCDIDGDSFVIFSNNEKECSLFSTSFGGCRPQRQRQISECSDDSFVVFFTEDADCLGELRCSKNKDCVDDDDLDDLYDDSEDETSSEEEESCDDGSDDDDDDADVADDGFDVVDSSFVTRNIKTDSNKSDQNIVSLAATTTATSSMLPKVQCDGSFIPSEPKQLDSGFEEKRVSFDPNPVVHVMHAWNFAYRAARKGHWEDVARDRDRFQQRIERTCVYLNPVLTPEHREKIYRSRFADDVIDHSNATQQQQNQQKQQSLGSHHREATTASCNDDSQKLPKLTKLPDCASF